MQNEYRNFAFGSIVFTPDHLADKTAANPTREKVYTYTVVEYKDPSEPETVNGITNDSDSDRTFTVTLSVDPVTDNLKAVVSPQPLVDELTFTNKYSAEGEGEILVRKELLGREWLNGDSFDHPDPYIRFQVVQDLVIKHSHQGIRAVGGQIVGKALAELLS